MKKLISIFTFLFLSGCATQSFIHNPNKLEESKLAKIQHRSLSFNDQVVKNITTSGVIKVVDMSGKVIVKPSFSPTRYIRNIYLTDGTYTITGNCGQPRSITFKFKLEAGKIYQPECNFNEGNGKYKFSLKIL